MHSVTMCTGILGSLPEQPMHRHWALVLLVTQTYSGSTQGPFHKGPAGSLWTFHVELCV